MSVTLLLMQQGDKLGTGRVHKLGSGTIFDHFWVRGRLRFGIERADRECGGGVRRFSQILPICSRSIVDILLTISYNPRVQSPPYGLIHIFHHERNEARGVIRLRWLLRFQRVLLRGRPPRSEGVKRTSPCRSTVLAGCLPRRLEVLVRSAD